MLRCRREGTEGGFVGVFYEVRHPAGDDCAGAGGVIDAHFEGVEEFHLGEADRRRQRELLDLERGVEQVEKAAVGDAGRGEGRDRAPRLGQV